MRCHRDSERERRRRVEAEFLRDYRLLWRFLVERCGGRG